MSEDLGADHPSLEPVPIALTQDPAPVDLDMIISQGYNQQARTTTTVISGNPTDYALKKTHAMIQRRSTTDMKNCFSDKAKQEDSLNGYVQSSPHNTEGATGCSEPVGTQ